MTTYQIRAMSLGEILDGAFAVYRRHFGTLFGIAVVCYGIPALLDIMVELRGGVLYAWGTWTLARVLNAIGGLIAAGATVKVVSDAFLGQEPVMGDAMYFAAGRMWRILVAGIAKYLLILLASILLIVPGIIVACGYAVVVQAVVLEDLAAPTDALGRSWSLTRDFKGKAFFLGVVLFALLMIPTLMVGSFAALVPVAAVFLTSLAMVVQLLVYPVFGCAFTLFYYDLRVRKEGFDLEHLGTQLGVSVAPAGA
jgi:hypothetical protein